MNTENEDTLIRELMQRSVRKMPFADFEEKLMEQIHEKEETSRSFLKDIKLSWFFFIVGTLFGLFLNMIVANIDGTILGFSVQRFSLIIQALFVILLLTQFDKLAGLTKSANDRKVRRL